MWVGIAGAAAIVVTTIVAARWPPGWYAARAGAAGGAAADRDARRLVTAVAGLEAAANRPGEWGIVVREQEINAWLAADLPRNHAGALPAGVTEPRVRLEPGRVRIAARVGAGPFAGVAAVDVDVKLRAANQLECRVAGARLGAIPLPAGPVTHRLAALCGGLGLTADVRRLDGRSVIVVSWGGRGTRLEGLAVNDGELMVAGKTEEKR